MPSQPELRRSDRSGCLFGEIYLKEMTILKVMESQRAPREGLLMFSFPGRSQQPPFAQFSLLMRRFETHRFPDQFPGEPSPESCKEAHSFPAFRMHKHPYAAQDVRFHFAELQ